jgi:hypothetical protein
MRDADGAQPGAVFEDFDSEAAARMGESDAIYASMILQVSKRISDYWH